MTLRRLVIAAVIVLALGVASAGAVWYFFIRNDSPPAVSLEAALTAITPQSTTSGPGGLTGTWHVVQGVNSFVGYRVDETLAGFGANTAVGRTQSIEGTLNYDGKSITAVSITADLSALSSDKSQRDGTLRTQAIETSRFPSAIFVLTSPINISAPAEGETVTQKVSGNLTLHGVTRQIEIEVQGVLRGGQVIIVGSTDILFADYNIGQPRAATVLSVKDHGAMEFQLVFAK